MIKPPVLAIKYSELNKSLKHFKITIFVLLMNSSIWPIWLWYKILLLNILLSLILLNVHSIILKIIIY